METSHSRKFATTPTKTTTISKNRSTRTNKFPQNAPKIKPNDSDGSPKNDKEWAQRSAVGVLNAEAKSPKAIQLTSAPRSPSQAIFQVPESKRLTPAKVEPETTDSEVDFWQLKDHPAWDKLFSLVKEEQYSPAYAGFSSSMSADEQQTEQIWKKYEKYKKRKRHYQNLLYGKSSKKSKNAGCSEDHAHSSDSKGEI